LELLDLLGGRQGRWLAVRKKTQPDKAVDLVVRQHYLLAGP
jgi:hypothetical protein